MLTEPAPSDMPFPGGCAYPHPPDVPRGRRCCCVREMGSAIGRHAVATCAWSCPVATLWNKTPVPASGPYRSDRGHR